MKVKCPEFIQNLRSLERESLKECFLEICFVFECISWNSHPSFDNLRSLGDSGNINDVRNSPCIGVSEVFNSERHQEVGRGLDEMFEKKNFDHNFFLLRFELSWKTPSKAKVLGIID